MFPSTHKKVNLWFQQKLNNAQSIYEKAEGEKKPSKTTGCSLKLQEMKTDTSDMP